MVSEYVYLPHVDFFIDRVDRDTGYEMASFHIHHKYEIYYEIEGSRRYFIEDAAYIVNAGCVVLIGENQIHKTASLGDTASSRIVANFSREYLGKITDIFPEVDFFSFLNEEHNHLLSNITVKQQNHIHNLLQQLLALQEETSPDSDAMRKMLLATLMLELKDLCRQQQEQGQIGYGTGCVQGRSTLLSVLYNIISQDFIFSIYLFDKSSIFSFNDCISSKISTVHPTTSPAKRIRPP